jgi:hypothetical protein
MMHMNGRSSCRRTCVVMQDACMKRLLMQANMDAWGRVGHRNEAERASVPDLPNQLGQIWAKIPNMAGTTLGWAWLMTVDCTVCIVPRGKASRVLTLQTDNAHRPDLSLPRHRLQHPSWLRPCRAGAWLSGPAGTIPNAVWLAIGA